MYVCMYAMLLVVRVSGEMNKSCEQFGIRITNQQIQTKARVLPPPCIQYSKVGFDWFGPVWFGLVWSRQCKVLVFWSGLGSAKVFVLGVLVWGGVVVVLLRGRACFSAPRVCVCMFMHLVSFSEVQIVLHSVLPCTPESRCRHCRCRCKGCCCLTPPSLCRCWFRRCCLFG